MIRYERSKSSMFLLEILINILLFSVLCVCSLQFFIKSYQLTEQTTTLHHAVTACNNIASIYKSSDDSFDLIMATYPDAIEEGGVLYIYLNENYQECDSQDVAYYITVSKQVSTIPSICITFYKNGEAATYTIDVYHYDALSPADIQATGGATND